MNQRLGKRKQREMGALIPPVLRNAKKVNDPENIHHTRTTIKGNRSWTTPLKYDPVISKGDKSRIKRQLKREREMEQVISGSGTGPKIIIE